ncbi:collagenase [Streptomyces sp. NPDC051561]|uniref:collagenase n=1 Tax=Streptomyces sp. NPDC051561 TaxID=3365658 RepID=UPI003792DC4D
MSRRILLAATLSATLALPLVQTSAQAAPLPPTPAPAAAALPQPKAPAPNPFDEVRRLAKAPQPASQAAPAPRSLTAQGRIPGTQTKTVKGTGTNPAKGAQRSVGPRAAVAPCTLDGITGLSPARFADFLADPAVTADGCLRDLIWTWDARLIPVMSDAHVQAVSQRAQSLAAAHDGRNTSHLLEIFTYLHAVAYHDFSRDEIDITDAPTVDAMRRAIAAFGTAARTFDVTKANAETLREALIAASSPGLRQHQLALVKKVLATMDPSHTATHKDRDWAGAAFSALTLNYLGVYSGNQDTAFRAAVSSDASYRATFKAFAGYTHLKGTENEWVVRDALGEYGRFGEIPALKDGVVADLGTLLTTAKQNFGEGSQPWAKVATWLNYFGACKQYGVCKEDIEKRIFPYTYSYDNGAIKVRTGLDRATVDQLYYASKQVKAQFHRVIGTTEPLAGDTNTTLNIVLYGSRADYETYHPLLTGMDTNNGGIYIERGATFYTYQRRVPQDSSLTLEELFRHEYVHYLNGRFAVHGSFGEGPWYQGDRTTAMDEGTGEFFDGATRDDGIAVRQSLVEDIIQDTSGGGPRMTVNQLLHATYDGDGFRFYSYAGTFFEYLWRDHPGKLQEMYRHLRSNDPAAFDGWRNQQGSDTNLQRGYDAFLDQQIAIVDDLFVPNTQYTPNGSLKYTAVADVRSAFRSATSIDPACKDDGGKEMGRFICTGRITANISNPNDPSTVFKEMSETVDYFILDRSKPAANNLADMNCSFGKVALWSSGQAGSADYVCEGPLKR